MTKKGSNPTCLNQAHPKAHSPSDHGGGMRDKCFFCGKEGSLILQCQGCMAFNIEKTVGIFAENSRLKEKLREMEGDILKTIALLADMRMVDKYHSHAEFDVEEWEKDLRKRYSELVKKSSLNQ